MKNKFSFVTGLVFSLVLTSVAYSYDNACSKCYEQTNAKGAGCYAKAKTSSDRDACVKVLLNAVASCAKSSLCPGN